MDTLNTMHIVFTEKLFIVFERKLYDDEFITVSLTASSTIVKFTRNILLNFTKKI